MKTKLASKMALNSIRAAVLAAVAVLLPAIARAQAGLPLWTNCYSGPGNTWDKAQAIAVDANDNVIVTGYGDYGDGSYGELTTIKYSSAGVLLWTNRGPAAIYHSAIAVDASDNIVVAGNPYDASLDYKHFVTIKYSSAGVPLWTNRYSGSENCSDNPSAVAVDTNGNVFVTGQTGCGGIPPAEDFATIKYSSAGVPLWTNRYNGLGGGCDGANAIAVDANGNVYVTGGSCSGSFYWNSDYATIKYSNAGVPLWTKRYDSGDGMADMYDSASAIALDASGNVVVTGSADGNHGDYVTIKYSSAGVPLWTNRFNGPGNGPDGASAVAVGTNGNVYVTGSSATTYDTNTSAYVHDYATIAYSSAGVPLWTNYYNGPGNGDDGASDVALDARGNVYVTGSSATTYDTNERAYIHDYVTVAYSSAGVPLWTNCYNGPANRDDSPSAIAVDGSGNVYVTGSSTASNGFPDYVTIKYAGVPPVPPHLQNSRLEAGQFACDLDGEPGRKLLLQASTDLLHWVTLQACQLTNSPLGYVDPESYLYPRRFYRLRAAEGVALMERPNWSADQFKLSLVGEPGRVVVVQASTNLVDWTPIATNTLGSAPLPFSDPDSALFHQRFYRLQKP